MITKIAFISMIFTQRLSCDYELTRSGMILPIFSTVKQPSLNKTIEVSELPSGLFVSFPKYTDPFPDTDNDKGCQSDVTTSDAQF